MLPTFGLIHMNGRMGACPERSRRDPLLGRMLSPDNYVHPGLGPDGYNRYAYAGNNPLKYVDPSGEVVMSAIIIGAMIGAFANIVYQGWSGNAQTPGDFLKAGLIGGLSGGVGGGVGAGVSAAMPGAGFIYGFASGFSGGFAGGFISGFGNSYIGSNPTVGQALGNGLKAGLVAGATSGLIAGVGSGIQAVKAGRRFWDGALVEEQVIVNQNIPGVRQEGEYNCGPACAESVDRSLGGDIDQTEVREWIGGDPARSGIEDRLLWKTYADKSGYQYRGVSANRVSAADVAG